MAAPAGLAMADFVDPIFQDIFDCIRLYLTNFSDDIVFELINCCWIIGITFIFDGAPQIIVQRCQIAASRWPVDITNFADNAIFEFGAH